MTLSEYVEKIVTEGYKQQIADEEDVPRSLPFFAAALAVLVAIVGVVKDAIPRFSLAPYPATVWVILALLTVALFLVLVFLQRAVRERNDRYVMSEVDLRDYVDALRAYYAADPALNAGDREIAIIEDVRTALTTQYSEAATTNRGNNAARAKARAAALSSLVGALFFAFEMIAIILMRQKALG